MRVKLLAPHVLNGQQYAADTILDVDTVTPLMIGLDSAAQSAIRAEIIRVYGRWVIRDGKPALLDDPPIVRTLENAQPVLPIGGGGPPR
jgi:hypothetical protein